MDWELFIGSVQGALKDLYDESRPATLELGRYLSDRETPLPADRLHQLLFDAVTGFRPPPGTPPTSAAWRRHYYLERRYLDNVSHQAIALQLGMSLRQAHRLRVDAVEAVAEALWKARPSHPGRTSEGVPVRGRATQTTLAEEVARLGREGGGAPVDLVSELNTVLEVIQPLARQRGVTVDLAPHRDTQLVLVGRAVLRQMVVLLVSYALERHPRGRLLVATDATSETVLVDIVYSSPETGGGEVLSQQDSRLVTARQLVEAQNGTLDVLADGDHTMLRLMLRPCRVVTVLTIDDNPDLAHLFALFLQATRYHVLRAKTATGALRLAEQSRPDIITLDVMMPFQDGWEIFRSLRDNPVTKAIPVVVCSILPERDLALALGAVDFLAKPVTRASLITTLDRCLGSGPEASRGPFSGMPSLHQPSSLPDG